MQNKRSWLGILVIGIMIVGCDDGLKNGNKDGVVPPITDPINGTWIFENGTERKHHNGIYEIVGAQGPLTIGTYIIHGGNNIDFQPTHAHGNILSELGGFEQR